MRPGDRAARQRRVFRVAGAQRRHRGVSVGVGVGELDGVGVAHG